MGKINGKISSAVFHAGKMIVLVFLSVSLFFVFHSECVQASSVKAADFDQYSNYRHAWYFMKKTDHSRPDAASLSFSLKRCEAYYVNENVEKKDQVIYLTFDCGYENGYTGKILDTLKKHHVKAAFFVVGTYIEQNPKLVMRMKREGHLVCNHSVHHPDFTSISTESLIHELNSCKKTMKKVTGYELDPFVRPPEGCFSQRTLKISKAMGYKTVFWSMAFMDWDVNNQPGADYVVDYFKQNHHNGAIPLLHVVSSSDTAALGTILTYLKGEGYRFGSLTEL